MRVKDYAATVGIPVRLFTDLLSEMLDMRVTPAQDVDEAALHEAHETIESAAIDELEQARDELADAREYAEQTVKGAETFLRNSVRQALKEGMPAVRVAEVLGVSRARVYQIRDGKR